MHFNGVTVRGEHNHLSLFLSLGRREGGGRHRCVITTVASREEEEMAGRRDTRAGTVELQCIRSPWTQTTALFSSAATASFPSQRDNSNKTKNNFLLLMSCRSVVTIEMRDEGRGMGAISSSPSFRRLLGFCGY